MPRKFIDLSVSLQEGIKSDPDFMLPKINYHHHNETAEEMISFFPGLKKEDLPGGEGWAMETITVSTHNGTHMDAPYHYHSTMDNGTRAITIDEVPLEWCFRSCQKLRPVYYVALARPPPSFSSTKHAHAHDALCRYRRFVALTLPPPFVGGTGRAAPHIAA